MALFVEMDVHEIAATLLHLHLLLAEGHEEVFHEAPVEECAEVVHPRHLEPGEVAHLGQRPLRRGHHPFLLVEVDEDVDVVADVRTLGNVSGRQQYVSVDLSPVEVQAKVDPLHHGEAVHSAQFQVVFHIALGLVSFSLSPKKASGAFALDAFLSHVPKRSLFTQPSWRRAFQRCEPSYRSGCAGSTAWRDVPYLPCSR